MPTAENINDNQLPIQIANIDTIDCNRGEIKKDSDVLLNN